MHYTFARNHYVNKTQNAIAAFFLFMTCIAVAPAYGEDVSFFSTYPHLDSKRWYISNGWTNGDHQACEWRMDAISVVGNDLQMTLSDKGGDKRPYGCAEMHTTAKTGYGMYQARMRVAAGSGLNTAFFTYIGKPEIAGNDEIDFEFLGKDTHSVQINYFTLGQGGHEKMIPIGFDASKEFHDYAILWEPKKITWYVDGSKVFETPGNAVLPKTPTQIFISLWSGSHIEDAWLGAFNYKAPVTAQVSWVKYTPAK